MSIKELRLKKGLTQVQASKLIGMELRTYQNYESGKSTRDSFKKKQIINILEEYEKYSESKGIYSLKEITELAKVVCEKYSVSYIYLFGSYAKGTAKDSSDVDLLIDCTESGLEFLGLAEELHEVLHKNIDLIKTTDLANNIDFLNEILRTGVKIY